MYVVAKINKQGINMHGVVEREVEILPYIASDYANITDTQMAKIELFAYCTIHKNDEIFILIDTNNPKILSNNWTAAGKVIMNSVKKHIREHKLNDILDV